jgi:hypothetical protein
MKKIEDLTVNEVIHCPTEQEAIALCKIMHELDFKWESGRKYIDGNYWSDYKERTCYNPKNRTFANKEFYLRECKTIYPASLFLPPHVYQGVPVYFAVKRDDSKEWNEYIGWLNETFGSNWGGHHYEYYGYDGIKACGGTYSVVSLTKFKNNPTVFKSPKEFMNLLNKNTMKTDNRFPLSLSFEHATDIINIACFTWREKLAKLWATDIILKKKLIISETFYKEMRGACTAEQHKLFDEIFGKDVEDKNAFVNVFDIKTLDDVSTMLFGKRSVLQIAQGAAELINKEDLVGRSLFISNDYETIVHKEKYGGTIIEIKKK